MTPLSPSEISTAESDIGHCLPSVYRDLLQRVGHGRAVDGTTVYHPSDIAELYGHHFESEGDLYARYFPIGCNETEQTIWLFDVPSERVATIYHDTHPDDYEDEDWMAPEDWLKTIGI